MYRVFCGRPASRVLSRIPAFSSSVPYVCRRGRMGSTSTAGIEPRPVFFFDIDNCVCVLVLGMLGCQLTDVRGVG